MSSKRNKLARHATQAAFWPALMFTAASSLGQTPTFDTGMPSGALGENPGVHLGRFDFHGGVQGSVAYDDLVVESNQGPISDEVWTLSPSITAQTEGPNARLLRLFYSPSFLVYTEHSNLDTVNHFGTFDLAWPLNRLTLNLAGRASEVTEVVRDVGNRATVQNYSALATAAYELSYRTTLEADASFQRSDYGSQLISSDQWGQQLWADYQLTSKLRMGLGTSITEIQVRNAPGQMMESPMVRATFIQRAELRFTASVGVQFEQFDSGAPDVVSPIMAVSGTYQIRPGTSLTLGAHRSDVQSGLLIGENYTDTGFNLVLSQALSHRLTASCGAGYTSAEYYSTEPGVQTHRVDNYYSVQASLDWKVNRSWDTGLFFQRTANSSSGSVFTYDHDIVGLRATWSF